MQRVVLNHEVTGYRALSSARSLGDVLYQLAYFFLWVFIFAVPFEEQFPPEVPHDIALSRWFGLAAGCLAFFRILITRHPRRPSILHGWMFVFVLWAGMSTGWSVAPDDTAIRVGTYVQLLIMVWLIWELAPTESRCIGLFYAYVFGTCVPALSTVHNFILNRSTADLRAATGIVSLDTDRFTAGHINENDLGLLLVLSVPLAVYLLTRKKSGLLGYLCWLQLAAAIMAILLTGSRASLISLGFAFLIVPLSLAKMSHARKSALLSGLAGACTGAVFFVPRETWDRLLTIGTALTEGSFTHRTSIWAAGVDVFRNNPLCGVGAGAFGTSVRSLLDVPYVSHNAFLSVLVELGTIGAMIFFVLLVSLLFSALHMPKFEKRLWIVLLLSWAVGVSSLTWEYRKPTWILFGLLVTHFAATYVPVTKWRARCNQMYLPQRARTWTPAGSEYLPELE
jgi:O-antigen ligase